MARHDFEWVRNGESHLLYQITPGDGGYTNAIAKISVFRGRSFMAVVFDTQAEKHFSCLDAMSYLSSTWRKWRYERTLKRAKRWVEGEIYGQ